MYTSTRRRAVSWVGAAMLPLVGACRMADCTPPDPSRPVSASEVVGGPAASLHGIVLSIANGRPIPGAQVRLVPGDTVWHGVSPDGRFVYRSIIPGAVLLEIQAGGYSDANISVRVRSDSAVAVVTALATSPAPVRKSSGCGDSQTSEPAGE